MSDGIRTMWMRGGTSKGGYFLADDLPQDTARRDSILLRVMGSPDPRQIDGLGGGVPVTSKVAVISESPEPGIDVDYLFLQVFVDRALVSGAQTCGNILAGVAPFAVERGLVKAREGSTEVTIRNLNTDQILRASMQTPGGQVHYGGDASIDGVPGTAAAISLLFSGLAGSKCGTLLPTGNEVDVIDDLACTLIDNGMPTVVINARDLGLSGDESPEQLEADTALKARLEGVRQKAGPLMNLCDVAEQSVPKMCLVSPPKIGGALNTRCFIPHACHQTIGVLCAVSVASACLLKSGPAKEVSNVAYAPELSLDIEHPTGKLPVQLCLDANGHVREAGSIRTARKLFDGVVFHS